MMRYETKVHRNDGECDRRDARSRSELARRQLRYFLKTFRCLPKRSRFEHQNTDIRIAEGMTRLLLDVENCGPYLWAI